MNANDYNALFNMVKKYGIEKILLFLSTILHDMADSEVE